MTVDGEVPACGHAAGVYETLGFAPCEFPGARFCWFYRCIASPRFCRSCGADPRPVGVTRQPRGSRVVEPWTCEFCGTEYYRDKPGSWRRFCDQCVETLGRRVYTIMKEDKWNLRKRRAYLEFRKAYAREFELGLRFRGDVAREMLEEGKLSDSLREFWRRLDGRG